MSDALGHDADDPFDVASGDMNAVARRVEQFLDAEDDRSWLDQARGEIAAGRTFPLDELADRKARSSDA